jgi:hypothetical protein
MAAAFFNQLADPQKAHAVSAGTDPDERAHLGLLSSIEIRQSSRKERI